MPAWLLKDLKDSSNHLSNLPSLLVYKDCEVFRVIIITDNFTNFKGFKDLAD